MVSPISDISADNLLYPTMVRPHIPKEEESQASLVSLLMSEVRLIPRIVYFMQLAVIEYIELLFYRDRARSSLMFPKVSALSYSAKWSQFLICIDESSILPSQLYSSRARRWPFIRQSNLLTKQISISWWAREQSSWSTLYSHLRLARNLLPKRKRKPKQQAQLEQSKNWRR